MDIATVLTNLAACLCAELTPTGATGPNLCFCGVLPGEIAIADVGDECGDVSCGMAWVRVMQGYSALEAGQPNISSSNCNGYIGFDIEMGVLRCIETPADGGAPSADSLAGSVEQQMGDAMAMRRAVQCCLGDDVDFVLGQYSPAGPRGGLLGGTWVVSVAL